AAAFDHWHWNRFSDPWTCHNSLDALYRSHSRRHHWRKHLDSASLHCRHHNGREPRERHGTDRRCIWALLYFWTSNRWDTESLGHSCSVLLCGNALLCECDTALFHAA